MVRRVKVKRYYLVAVYYWSPRTKPTYLKRTWKTSAVPECSNYYEEPFVALSKDGAESEAVLFLAVHPKYIGSVKIQETNAR